jgi:hypothetical protein
MEIKMIKEIKKWVLFNILKGKAHLLRLKHFLTTGRDIEMLPPPQKEYTRVYFFEIENGDYVLKHHEIPLSLLEKFDEDFSKKKDGLMGLTREQVVRWVIENQKLECYGSRNDKR